MSEPLSIPAVKWNASLVERVTCCIIERQQCIVTCRDVSAALIAVRIIDPEA
jgi:hypothetical protein